MKLHASIYGIGIAVGLTIGMLVQSGCTTTTTNSNGTTSTNKVDYVAIANKASGILTATVSGAVVYGCQKDKNAYVYINAARTLLNEMLLSENLDAAEVQRRLMELPINEFKTDEAKLVIAPLIGMYQAFAADMVKAGYQKREALQILIKSLIDGIDVGLKTYKM